MSWNKAQRLESQVRLVIEREHQLLRVKVSLKGMMGRMVRILIISSTSTQRTEISSKRKPRKSQLRNKTPMAPSTSNNKSQKTKFVQNRSKNAQEKSTIQRKTITQEDRGLQDNLHQGILHLESRVSRIKRTSKRYMR